MALRRNAILSTANEDTSISIVATSLDGSRRRGLGQAVVSIEIVGMMPALLGVIAPEMAIMSKA